jgi:O-antigen/teichoic acid export membrane protein
MPPEHQPPSLYGRIRNLLNARTVTVQASALVAGRWAQEAFRFFLLLWLARTSQSGFGLFVFGAGVAAIIHPFLALGFEQFTIRELAGNSDAGGRILGQMLRLKTLIGLLLLSAIAALGSLQGWSSTEIMVVLIIAAGKILDSWADTLFSLYRYAGRQVQEAAYSVKAALVGALYGAAALLGGGGIVAVSLFVIVSSGLKVLLAAGLGARTGLLPKMRGKGPVLPPGRIGALLMIGALSFLGSFYNQVQVLLLKYFKALSDLAYYGVAMELAGGLAGLVSALVIGAVIYPTLTRTATQGADRLAAFISAYFWRLAALGLGIAFFYVTLGEDLLLFVYGSQYNASVAPMQIMGLATVFSFVNNLLIHAFLAQHRERLLLLLHLAPACLSLALGVTLVPWLGAKGAALNLLACRMVMALFILTAAHWHFGIFRRDQVEAFLWGGLILGGFYAVLATIDLSMFHLLAVLFLGGYGWWTWRWTMGPASLLKAGAEERYGAP